MVNGLRNRIWVAALYPYGQATIRAQTIRRRSARVTRLLAVCMRATACCTKVPHTHRYPSPRSSPDHNPALPPSSGDAKPGQTDE